MLQILICSDENLKVVRLGCVQQLPISKRRPTSLISSNDVVTGEERPQRRRRALVEENAHLRSSRAPGYMFEDLSDLSTTHAGKPRHELFGVAAIL